MTDGKRETGNAHPPAPLFRGGGVLIWQQQTKLCLILRTPPPAPLAFPTRYGYTHGAALPSNPTTSPLLWLRALWLLAAPGFCHSERSEESEPLSARSFAMLRMTDGKQETGNTHPPAPLQGGGDKVEYSHASGTQAVKRGWGFNPAIAANRAGG